MAKINKTPSIKTLIVGTFLGVIIFISLTVGVIVFSNWYNISNRNANLMANQITQSIESEISNFIFTPEHINAYNYLLLSGELIDTEGLSSNEGFFLDVLKFHQHEIFSTVFATVNGEMFGASRINGTDAYEIIKQDATTDFTLSYFSVNEDGSKGDLSHAHESFDPRTREWYLNAVNNGKATYTPLYEHETGEFTFTSSLPVYDDQNQLIGVLATHVTFEQLNQFLELTMSQVNGNAVIFENNTDYLLANSSNLANFTLVGDHASRIVYQDIVDTNVIEAYAYYLENGISQFRYDGTGEAIFVNIISYEDDEIGWTIITALPESFFMSDVYQSLNFTIGIILIIMFLGVFVYLKLAKVLFKSLEELVNTATIFAGGDFSVRSVKKRNDEVGQLADAFNHMANNIDHLVNNLESIVSERTNELTCANEEIIKGQEKLKSILDSTAEGIYGIDIDGMCTFVNYSAVQQLGFNSDQDIIGKNIHDLIHHRPDQLNGCPANNCPMLNAVRLGEPISVARGSFYKKDGSKLKVRYAAYPQYESNQLIGAVVSFTDNAKEQEREEKMEYISYHDYLTGLYNRRFFVEELARKDHKDYYPLGIIMLDLNALKLFNDAFGHFTGDQALIELSRVLEDITREDGFVCRQGGDKFAIILPNSSETELNSLKHVIKNNVSSIKIENVELSVAVGYECKYDEKTSLDDVLKNAEDHMYKNKMSERLNVNNSSILAILNTLFDKHPNERKHAEEVSQLAKKMGKALKLKSNEIHDISIAGLYHDIGKISVSDQILDKAESLTEAEFNEIKKHAEVGYQILKAADEFSEYAVHAYSHHENFDGSGYPRKLIGKEIPLFSRIISIVNAYDNMTTNHSYRKAMSVDDATIELKRCAGTQFDPDLVDIFITKVLKK
ncbi:MAG: diguanylate cyclase [Acholeplasmataceae bacterium]|nr:diguanylate cyclase [Acholeplasmataceae bacterium]